MVLFVLLALFFGLAQGYGRINVWSAISDISNIQLFLRIPERNRNFH